MGVLKWYNITKLSSKGIDWKKENVQDDSKREGLITSRIPEVTLPNQMSCTRSRSESSRKKKIEKNNRSTVDINVDIVYRVNRPVFYSPFKFTSNVQDVI